MEHVKAGIVARTIQARHKRDKRFFSAGAFLGAMGGAAVCRILFSIRCKRCRHNARKAS